MSIVHVLDASEPPDPFEGLCHASGAYGVHVLPVDDHVRAAVHAVSCSGLPVTDDIDRPLSSAQQVRAAP